MALRRSKRQKKKMKERDKMNTGMGEAQRRKKTIEFEKWVHEYGIGTDKHGDLTVCEQFDEAMSEVTRLKGSEIDKFSFCCGAITSIAHLHPDVLEEFVDKAIPGLQLLDKEDVMK